MMNKTPFLLFLLLVALCLTVVSEAQVFSPVTRKFDKVDYKAANQNWSAAQTSDGRLYFGNNDGLLQFDGLQWKLFWMPRSKLVRSVMVDTQDRIYVGSFEEFGYFTRDNKGALNYYSLSDLLEGYKLQNDEIWNIISFRDKVIFQSFNSYFVYDGKRVTGYRLGFITMFFCVFNQGIYCHSDQVGFSRLDLEANSIQPLSHVPFTSSVVNILPYDSQRALIVTKFEGLFLFDGLHFVPFHTPVDALLKRADLNRAIMTRDSIYILGTIQNGVTAIDRKGHRAWTLNRASVLQNNTVLGLYCDKDNNIWVCHDVGISMIQHSSPLRLIKSFEPTIGAIYTVWYEAPLIYIGTNQGLYVGEYDLSDGRIRNLQLQVRVKGQVWDISKIDKQVICSFNDGTCELVGREVRKISPVKGGVCISRGIINGREVLIQGTYAALCVYVREGDKWKFSHTVENFINPIRFLEIDHTGTIWAAHFHEGMFAIQLSSDLKKAESVVAYPALDGKNKVNVGLFMLNDRIVFTDHTRYYTYDYLKKQVVAYDDLNSKTGCFAGAYRVSKSTANSYWLIADREAALFEMTHKAFRQLDQVSYDAFPNLIVEDNQVIVPVSDHNYLLTLENGLALYHQSAANRIARTQSLKIGAVTAFNDEESERLSLALNPDKPYELRYTLHNVQFSVFFPDYVRQGNVFFRYKLVGLDKVWSTSSLPDCKYHYLSYGDYVFRAEVVSTNGNTLSSVSYAFVIQPPWYLSFWAWTLYLTLCLWFILVLVWYVSKRFRVKKEYIRMEQEELRRKEIDLREQQIVALEKEVLEAELKLKSKELAGSTMTIIKNDEMLHSLRNEVDAQRKLLGSQYPKKYYDRLITLIDENLSSEDKWAVFQTNFDRIHENFFRNLKLQYPTLTSNDLRFCAYLRLNLSSKDIAHLMHITLKGVEVGRYRIRKKMGVPSSKSLAEFMIEFH